MGLREGSPQLLPARRLLPSLPGDPEAPPRPDPAPAPAAQLTRVLLAGPAPDAAPHADKGAGRGPLSPVLTAAPRSGTLSLVLIAELVGVGRTRV